MNKYDIQRKFFYIYVGVYYIGLNFNLKKTPKQMERKQERELRKFIKKAYKIPFYKKRFDSVNVRPEDIKVVEDLSKLPVLTKSEYREWMLEEENKARNRSCMRSKTSGSTGTPTPLLFTPKEYAQDIAHALRTWKVCGYSPVWGKTMTRMQASSEQVGYKTIIQKIGVLRREMIDQSKPEKEVIEKINMYKPDLLQMCLPEFIKIAVYAKKNNMKIHHPKFVYSLGEVIDENAEKIIFNAFGEGLMSNYGCAEMGEVSTRVPGNRNYLIHQDMYAVMIFNGKKYSTEGIGDIYLTSLYRDTFPLINYDVGDIGRKELIDGREYITEIRGRKNDVFYFDDGSVITYYALDGIVVKFANQIMQMKFIQKDYYNILLQVVKDPVSEYTKNELQIAISKEMNKICPPSVEYQFDWVEVIEPESNGKIRMMVSEIG